jgi:hypothetical protein
MVSSFETTLKASRPVADVLGDDWVEVEPGIYVQSVDTAPTLTVVSERGSSYDPFYPTT